VRIRARAPGKLVILGEYAVLEGAEALVMAVSRRCHALVGPARGGLCRLVTWAPQRAAHRFAPGERSGVGLVDLVTGATDARAPGPWSAEIDSRALYSGRRKLGLGSSAAALTAFAGAWSAYRAGAALPDRGPGVTRLIELHRRLQGGAGSGLDVAAAVTGGVISFAIGEGRMPQIGSVQLPNSVGFAGIFTGASASTPDFVTRFRAWRLEAPSRFRQQIGVLSELASAGCAAVRSADADAFLAVVGDYGRQLERLGERLGLEIVTSEHRELTELAARCGVAYKVSGAGGGDLGIAFGKNSDALEAFEHAVRGTRYEWIELDLDRDGLVVEELRS
jgi:phosphomevalonate kinase